MAAQTWDLAYFATIVDASGSGDTTSQGAGSVTAPQAWPFDYASLLVPVTGSGNTDSTGGGSVSTPQAWDLAYWDGVTWASGPGNTNSTGVGAVTAVNLTWYDLTGTVSEPADGAGNTTSQGGDIGVTVRGSASAAGVGNTLSAGIGNVTVWGGEVLRVRPFYAPLDASSVTAPLDVVAVTAPLDMDVEV